MGIKNFTMNISGVVAESNNNVSSFGVWFDSQSKALLTGSEDAFVAVFGSKSAIITSLLSKFSPATISFTYPTSSLVVNSFTMVVSGVVAYTDNTVESFSFEVRDDGNVYKHIDTSNTTFDALVTDTSANTLIAGMWHNITGKTVTITN
jgi:hypothetical protein